MRNFQLRIVFESPGIASISYSHLLYACRFTSCKAFKKVMGEITDLAGQHEIIAENFQSDIIKEIVFLIKDFKEERKKVNIIHCVL